MRYKISSETKLEIIDPHRERFEKFFDEFKTYFWKLKRTNRKPVKPRYDQYVSQYLDTDSIREAERMIDEQKRDYYEALRRYESDMTAWRNQDKKPKTKGKKEEMTYRIAVAESKRENRPNDLVRLQGGQKNCFHIRKRPDGALKKLKPLVVMIVDEKGNYVSAAPENVIKELDANRMDDGDVVTLEYEYQDLLGNWYPYNHEMGISNSFYMDRIRIKRNLDNTVSVKIIPILNHHPSR